MGMFDYVNYAALCRYCDEPLQDFQSKDRDCELETIEPCEVFNFYSYCDNCKKINNFKVKKVITQVIHLE